MDALNEIMTKNFDDKEPDEVQNQLEEFDRRTRVLTVVNNNARATLARRTSKIANLLHNSNKNLNVSQTEDEQVAHFGTSNLFTSLPMQSLDSIEEEDMNRASIQGDN